MSAHEGGAQTQARSRVKVVVVLVVAQAVLAAGYLLVERARRRESAPPLEYERLAPRAAPELELERPDGARVVLSSLRGRHVLLHFWGTWCAPCREELPELFALARRSEGSGLVVAAVALDPEWPEIRAFAGEAPAGTLLRDPTGAARDRYGLRTLPETFLVDPAGNLTLRFGGPRAWSSDAVGVLLDAELGRR